MLFRSIERQVREGLDPIESVRTTTAASLPVPVTLTKGQVTGDKGQQLFEDQAAASVYGDIPEFPPTEDVNKNPVSPYGISKSCIEDMLPDYERAYGMNYAILRYFNAAGAALDNTHGYKQHKATHIIPILCRKVLNNETLTIFGQNYDTPDGTTQRDYVHVEDLAEAHIKAMEYLQTGCLHTGWADHMGAEIFRGPIFH